MSCRPTSRPGSGACPPHAMTPNVAAHPASPLSTPTRAAGAMTNDATSAFDFPADRANATESEASALSGGLSTNPAPPTPLPSDPLLDAAGVDDFTDAPSPSTSRALPQHAGVSGLLSTMHGTETTLDELDVLPLRAARTRTIAIVALVILAVPLAIVIGGRKLLGASSGGTFGGLDGMLEEAREAERRHAWDGPPGHNFKELTDLALTRWPQSAALRDLRRDGADRLLADALGRKYANDLTEALHLVRIALELNPDLTAAQHLAAELTPPATIDVPHAVTATSPSADRTVKVPRHLRDGKPKESHAMAVPSPGIATGLAVAPPPETTPLEPSARPAAPASGPWL